MDTEMKGYMYSRAGVGGMMYVPDSCRVAFERQGQSRRLRPATDDENRQASVAGISAPIHFTRLAERAANAILAEQAKKAPKAPSAPAAPRARTRRKAAQAPKPKGAK